MNKIVINLLDQVSYNAIGYGIGALGGLIAKYCWEKNFIYYSQSTFAKVANAGAIVFSSFVFAADLPILLKKFDNSSHALSHKREIVNKPVKGEEITPINQKSPQLTFSNLTKQLVPSHSLKGHIWYNLCGMTGVGLATWKMGLSLGVAIHLSALGIFINYLPYFYHKNSFPENLKKELKKNTHLPKNLKKNNEIEDIENLDSQNSCSNCPKDSSYQSCETCVIIPQEMDYTSLTSKRPVLTKETKYSWENIPPLPRPIRPTLHPYAFHQLLHRSIFRLLIDSCNLDFVHLKKLCHAANDSCGV